jgi:hypothetical protein
VDVAPELLQVGVHPGKRTAHQQASSSGF